MCVCVLALLQHLSLDQMVAPCVCELDLCVQQEEREGGAERRGSSAVPASPGGPLPPPPHLRVGEITWRVLQLMTLEGVCPVLRQPAPPPPPPLPQCGGKTQPISQARSHIPVGGWQLKFCFSPPCVTSTCEKMCVALTAVPPPAMCLTSSLYELLTAE